MSKTRKLLSIGHSYVVRLNRRLVNEIAILAKGEWEVTTIAPAFIYGDLRPMYLENDPSEITHLESVPVYNSQYIHIMTYDLRIKEIINQDWDLVHSWQEPYILSGGQIAWCVPEGTPLIYRTAQSYSKRYPPPFNWIEQYAMSRSTGWICSGEIVAENLKSRQGYSLPMRLIPLGVDVKYFCPNLDAKLEIRRSLDWEQEGSPVIGYLGRFVSAKGLDLLMRVLDSLQTPWRALFVGMQMESSLRNWAKRYPEKIRICTNVKHDQVPHYLNAMDTLVAPSQTTCNWREQFGRMLIEAFACGIPVIGSDSGEIPYVIQDAGVIVGEKDLFGWVTAISNLLNSPFQRQELAIKGLERANLVYAWSYIAKQHLEFFNEML